MFDTIETDHGGEGAEPRAVEARNLDAATLEPRTYVERTGDFEKAEAVQKEFEAVTENAAAPAKEAPGPGDVGMIGDKGHQADEPGDGRGQDVELPAEPRLPAAKVEAAQLHQEEAEVERAARAEFSEAPTKMEPGVRPEAAADLPEARAEPGAAGPMPAGAGSPGGPMNVPDAEALIAGQGSVSGGTGPTYVGNIPGHGGSQFGSRGGTPGGFDGMPDLPDASGEMPASGGFSSSGGGAPVRMGGGGRADGEGKVDINKVLKRLEEMYDFFTAQDNLPACEAAAQRAQNLVELDKGVSPKDAGGTPKKEAHLVCMVGIANGPTLRLEYSITADDISRKSSWVREEPDDSNPTPYTGRFGTGFVPRNPDSKDDAGQVLPGADPGAFGGDVWRTDIDHTDDTGRFYGGIMSGPIKVYPDSGGAKPIDPKRATADAAPAELEGRKAKKREE